MLLVALLCFCKTKAVNFNFSVNRDNMVLSYYKHALNMVLRPASNSFDFLRLSCVSHFHSTAWQHRGIGLPSVHKTRGSLHPILTLCLLLRERLAQCR